MQLEIITPESKVFEGEAEAVLLPGLDGLFQVLKGHAPIISGLGKGVIKVDLSKDFSAEAHESKLIERDASNAKSIRITINGGVMELLNDKIIVLAE
jgi:F-type H+-transporting ATPase subunit epsilon